MSVICPAVDHPDDHPDVRLDPSGAVWSRLDRRPSNLSRLDPSGAVQVDGEHPSRNRKVVGSNPASGASDQQLS
jgi:hypothetical protein